MEDSNKRKRLLIGCSLIGDSQKKLLHRKSCKMVRAIPTEYMMDCSKASARQGYSPCPICWPCPVPDQGRQSKDEWLRAEMCRMSAKYKLKIQFKGTFAYVTSSEGEWYFSYQDRPVILHHKNREQWYDRCGNSTGVYHRQPGKFPSPLRTLVYIHAHDSAMATQRKQVPKT